MDGSGAAILKIAMSRVLKIVSRASKAPLPNRRYSREAQGAEVAYAVLWNVLARGGAILG